MAADITGTIKSLYHYPVKAVAGNDLLASQISEVGLKHDRQWMFVDESGQFVTQRQIPHLVWVRAQIISKGLSLSAPNQPDVLIPWPDANQHDNVSVKIWRDNVIALNCGDTAAKWITQYLDIPGKVFRLVQFSEQSRRFADLADLSLRPALNMFSDGYGLNVLSQAAITGLNDRLAENGFDTVDALRFRPNIVLDGLSAHDEDFFDDVTIHTLQGPVVIKLIKPCTRCGVPNIDPFTAIMTSEVNETLSTYRRLANMHDEICFGMNAIVMEGAGHTIRVGDRFEATFKFE